MVFQKGFFRANGAARPTDQMMRRLKELWMCPEVSIGDMSRILQEEYPYFLGSLTRSAVSGLINRARSKKEYKDWFPSRVSEGTRVLHVGNRVGVSISPMPHAANANAVTPLSRLSAQPKTQVEKATRASLAARMHEPKVKKSVPIRSKIKMSKYNDGILPGTPIDKDKARQSLGKYEAAFLNYTLDKPKTLLELEWGQCRWPIGDNNMYCGKQCIEGKSYCGFHIRMSSRGVA